MEVKGTVRVLEDAEEGQAQVCLQGVCEEVKGMMRGDVVGPGGSFVEVKARVSPGGFSVEARDFGCLLLLLLGAAVPI